MLQLGRIEANSFNFLPPFFPPTSTHLHEEVAVLDMQHFDDRNVFELRVAFNLGVEIILKKLGGFGELGDTFVGDGSAIGFIGTFDPSQRLGAFSHFIEMLIHIRPHDGGGANAQFLKDFYIVMRKAITDIANAQFLEPLFTQSKLLAIGGIVIGPMCADADTFDHIVSRVNWLNSMSDL